MNPPSWGRLVATAPGSMALRSSEKVISLKVSVWLLLVMVKTRSLVPPGLTVFFTNVFENEMSARSSDGITSRVPQARPEGTVFPSEKLDEILLEMLMFRPATSPTISNEMTQV